MARPREFDEDEALGAAMRTFWASGFDGTSLDALMSAMKLSRQSLYNAFGDKEALFMACLAHYQRTSLEQLEGAFAQGATKGFHQIFSSVIDESDEAKRRGCLMVNSAMELAPRDVRVADAVADNQRLLEDLFARVLSRGIADGEVPLAASQARATARFLVGALQGLRVLAKTDPRSPALRDMAAISLRVLRRD